MILYDSIILDWTKNILFNRSLKLEYSKDNNKTNSFEFHLPKNIFYNSTLNPDNNGFCSDNDCASNGVQSVRECRENGSIKKYVYLIKLFWNYIT